MKTVTCRQLGGMCDEEINANSYDEMISKGMAHVKDKHPEMAENIQKMAQDDPLMVDWVKKSHETWDNAPEM